MKLDGLNNKIRTKLLQNAIIIGVLVAVLIGAYEYSSSSTKDFEDSTAQLQQIKSAIVKKNDDNKKNKEALKEYATIDDLVKPTSAGYALARDRLTYVLPKIQEMKDIYSFKKLNLSLSEVKKAADQTNPKYGIYENEISVDFAGLTDEYIFSFISDLEKALPGYANIKELELKRNQDVTDANISNYFKDQNSAFVGGSIKLSWVTMKIADEKDKLLDTQNNKKGSRPGAALQNNLKQNPGLPNK